VVGMAAGLQRLVEDPGLAQRWGEAGRRRIQERFTIDHHLRDVAQFLRGISPRSRFQTSDR
jgi:glycosyltransferase involved in cell wall biosynthesis